MQLYERFSFIPHTLPIAPRPRPDELISSWLQRIARANALTLGELLDVAFLPSPGTHRGIGPLDDLSPGVIAPLATLGRIPRQSISALNFSQQFPYWSTQWLMRWLNSPLVLNEQHGSARARYAFCPRCVHDMGEKERTVWIRAEWACVLITHCRRHRIRLHERCPICFADDPISPGPTPEGIPSCRRCYGPLSVAIQLSSTPLTADVLRIEHRLWADAPFARQAHDAVQDLLCESEGTPVFLLMADDDPNCEQFLRGRVVPEAHLCFYSWSWRLLLVKALAEMTDR